MKYEKIFITGSTGVVGRPLLKKLVKEGHKVHALTRSNNNDEYFEQLGVTPVRGDLFDDSLKDKLFNLNIDAIFHVAGVNKMCSKNPSNMFKANIDGTKSMLSLGNSLKIKKFVYTSSAVTLGEQHGTVGSETSEHRGRFLSDHTHEMRNASATLGVKGLTLHMNRTETDLPSLKIIFQLLILMTVQRVII